MGSVRNPVGPLPSSIYWRRRTVAVLLVVLFAALFVWTVSSTGGGNSGNEANGSGGRTPAETITPGPTPSGSFVSSRPGGPGPAVGGDDGTSGSGDSGGGDGTTQTAAAGAAGGVGASGGAAELPAGSTMPDCVASTVSLRLRSVKNSYETTDTPQLQLIAVNGGPAACKLDFGSTSALFTIDDAHDAHIWASGDCPADRSAHLLQVPANGQTTFTLTWNRRTSSPQCATPGGQSVPNGATYLVQAKLPGFATRQTSFFLKSA